MARIASSAWVSGASNKSRISVYHVAFIVITMLLAIAVTIPTVISEHTLYRSATQVAFNPQELPGLVVQTRATPALLNSEQEIGALLKTDYPELGSRTTGIQYTVNGAGLITIITVAPTPVQAHDLAVHAAARLAPRMYNLLGDPLLREVLNHQAWQALSHTNMESAAAPVIADMLISSAIDGVLPHRDGRTVEQLTPQERFAVTRRLEILDDLKTLDVRKADEVLRAAKEPTAQTAAREQQRGARAAQQAVEGFLQYMYRIYHTTFDPLKPNSAFIQQVAGPGQAIRDYRLAKLLFATLIGLFGGLMTVAIDRSVGIVPTLLELWSYREMVRNIVGRDLKARYKSSLLGYLWSLLNPLMSMLIFWAVFGLLLRNDIPQFPVFLIVALLPWNYAVTAVSGGMRSIIDNANLVKKVYFPRAILPITTVLSNLVNYLLALPMMLLVMFGVQFFATGHIVLSWTFLYLPVLLLIQTIFLIGLTLLLSAMAVFFRDTTHIVDIVIQLWLFITPVFFSLTTVTGGNYLAARMVRWINPMASLVDFYRDVLYGHPTPHALVPSPPSLPALDGVFRTLVTALIVLAFGAYVFQHTSGRFGEEL